MMRYPNKINKQIDPVEVWIFGEGRPLQLSKGVRMLVGVLHRLKVTLGDFLRASTSLSLHSDISLSHRCTSSASRLTSSYNDLR